MKKIQSLASGITLLILLASCGGSEQKSDDLGNLQLLPGIQRSDTFKRFGLLSVSTYSHSFTFSGVFREFSEPVDANTVTNAMKLNSEDCSSALTSQIYRRGSTEIFGNVTSWTISAGAPLIISGDEGVIEEIYPLYDSYHGGFYSLDGAKENTFIFDIPGESFPGFSSLAIAPVPLIKSASTAINQENVKKTGLVTWEGNDDGNTFILVQILQRLPDPRGGNLVVQDCVVDDDGWFQIDPSFLEWMREISPYGYSVSIDRFGLNLHTSGDSILVTKVLRN